jgi:hypothetical protein
MRDGQFEGKGVEHPDIRGLFTRAALVESDWYADRLKARQEGDVQLWRRHVHYLESFLSKTNYADEAARLGIAGRLQEARQTLARVSGADYARTLVGTIGVQRLLPTSSGGAARPSPSS